MTHHRVNVLTLIPPVSRTLDREPLTCRCGQPWAWIRDPAGGYCLAENTLAGSLWELRQCLEDLAAAIIDTLPAWLRNLGRP